MAVHGHYHVALQGTAASRPAAPGYDLLYYATDTGQVSIYDTVGAAWSNVGFSGLASPVPIANGGTGQTGATAAFDALSPLTTQGDIIAHDGTHNIRIASPGADFRWLKGGDTGATGLAWQYNNSYFCMFSATPGVAFTTGAAYAAVFNGASSSSPTQTKLWLSSFKQARCHIRAHVASGVKSASCKIVNVTDGNDLTDVVTFNSGTYTTATSAWKTFTGPSTDDILIECQAIEGTGADIITIENIYTEIR